MRPSANAGERAVKPVAFIADWSRGRRDGGSHPPRLALACFGLTQAHQTKSMDDHDESGDGAAGVRGMPHRALVGLGLGCNPWASHMR